MRIIILQQHMRQWPLQVLVGNNKVYRGRGGLTNTPHLLYTFVLPTRAGNASGQISIYICVCQYTVAANIQWQWSEATALTLPRPPRHLYHHQCHSLTSRQASTFPLSPSEEDKKHFPIFFVLNLRSFRASLCLTPVCSHYCSPRFMGLAFSYTLYKCAFPNITLAPMYLITVNLPAFLNFA